jgi:hypothetical protein
MNETDESHSHIRRMREQAVELEADAERTSDPEERERLQRQVRKLEFDCEQESMMAAGDIYPTE